MTSSDHHQIKKHPGLTSIGRKKQFVEKIGMLMQQQQQQQRKTRQCKAKQGKGGRGVKTAIETDY